jgi:hypothetical protein
MKRVNMSRAFAIHSNKGYLLGSRFHPQDNEAIRQAILARNFEEVPKLRKKAEKRMTLMWHNFDQTKDVFLYPSLRAAREVVWKVLPKNEREHTRIHEFRFSGPAPSRLGIAYFVCKDPIEPNTTHPISGNLKSRS